MDFLGISEHNHSTAGLRIADYKKGSLQADTSNGKLNIAGKPFIAIHGMEWGTFSGGGHVVVYGFKDSLINWEANNYDIFVARSDYITLFDKIRSNPEAIATLAHPNSSDYTGLIGAYKGVADSAIASVAVESGPAFSTGTTYNDFPTSLAYISYYRSLLRQGYRVGANMDQDNHELTFGTANASRMVVLSKDRTREALFNGIRAMRVYASNDYNATVNFTINNYILGSSILTNTDLTGIVTYADVNNEPISAVQVYGGKVEGSDVSLVQSSTTNTAFTTINGIGETWFYYVIVTQTDGDKIITSPIWVTKTASPLPIKLVDFSGSLTQLNQILLKWNTSTEVDGDVFVVERSRSLLSFDSIGIVAGKGGSFQYSLIDNDPIKGINYYRLKQVDKNGRIEYSKIVSVSLTKQYVINISPNPSKGLITISSTMPVNQKVSLQIIDIAGNMVYNKAHAYSSKINIDVSYLPNGLYVIRVGDKLKKLIITH